MELVEDLVRMKRDGLNDIRFEAFCPIPPPEAIAGAVEALCSDQRF